MRHDQQRRKDAEQEWSVHQEAIRCQQQQEDRCHLRKQQDVIGAQLIAGREHDYARDG